MSKLQHMLLMAMQELPVSGSLSCHFRTRGYKPCYRYCNCIYGFCAMIAITGQVQRSLIGYDAFQEANITGITLPITNTII